MMSAKSVAETCDSLLAMERPIEDPGLSDMENEIRKIDQLDTSLHQNFEQVFCIDQHLTRGLVSFQDNKSRAVYRWYKYKEAFSASLVDYLLDKYNIRSGTLLDPFAGSGTALFAASARGMNADGIELLPIGHQIITTKICLDKNFTKEDRATLQTWITDCPWKKTQAKKSFTVLKITKDAYPDETHTAIEQYLHALTAENPRVQFVLQFALLCILESISYTRKDGQYLRWDKRSGRKTGTKPFDKGTICHFDEAITAKLGEILLDTKPDDTQSTLFEDSTSSGTIELFEGSCLELLPKMQEETYTAILTSPPYCNRYDYTRTYALELAMLGTSEEQLRSLRQTMISSTIENRAKDLLTMNPSWESVIRAVDRHAVLQPILAYLEDLKGKGELNNNGIPRMVRGYFYEMACVIAECYRVLKPGGYMFMVNDNVRYAGASISVDMILSDFAKACGFTIEKILVLPKGKGNSSQQMGLHGRTQLRKCVYVWRKQA
jgi:DNA modification methylase